MGMATCPSTDQTVPGAVLSRVPPAVRPPPPCRQLEQNVLNVLTRSSEMYFGRGDGVPDRLAEARAQARERRMEENRARRCAIYA